jgi:hypothetical protein
MNGAIGRYRKESAMNRFMQLKPRGLPSIVRQRERRVALLG